MEHPLIKLALITTFLVGLCPARTHAQSPGSLVTIALAGKAVVDLIKQFEETANRVLQNAGQQGDILASTFGNQLRVATRNLDIALADQQSTLFDNLSPVEQGLFVQLNQIIETANKSVGQAVK